MHILIDLQSCQNGSRNRGIGRYALSLTRALIERGRARCTFSVVLSDLFPDSIADIRYRLSDLLPVECIHVLRTLGQNSAADPANAWRREASQRLRERTLSNLRPDVVFDPSPLEGLWDDTTTSVWSGRHVNAVALHDLIPLTSREEHLPREQDFQAYLRRLEHVRKADLVLAVSSHTRNESVRLLGIDPQKVIVAELGSDGNLFSPSASQSAEVEDLFERVGIRRKFILNTSPLEHRKNIEGMIAGYAQLSSAVRDEHDLVIVGRFDSYAKTYIAGLATAEGIVPSRILLPGYVTDQELSILYAQCRAFVFPSLSEGFGLPALEAMACGAAVIGSGCTSIPEVIGRADLLFDPRKPGEIATRLERLLTDETFRTEVQTYGIGRAAAFTWEKTAEKALNAMEMSFLAKQKDNGLVSGTEARPTDIAFVWPPSRRGGRMQGVARRLCRLMAETANVVVVSDTPAEKDEWMEANLEFRPIQWLQSAQGKNYHAVHLLASDAKQTAIDRLIENCGTVVVVDEIAASHQDIGETPLWAADLLVTSGAAKLAEGLRQGLGGTAVMSGRSLEGLADRILISGSASGAPGVESGFGVTLLPLLPIMHCKSARENGRKRLEIGNETLVAAFVANETCAGKIVNLTRRANPSSKLLVQYVKPVAGTKIESLTAGVWQRYFTEFDYEELLNSADEVVVAEELDAAFIDTLREDCAALGVRLSLFAEAGGAGDSVSGLAGAQDRFRVWFNTPFSRRSIWLRDLVSAKRGTVPTGEDLINVSNTLAANEAVRRKPAVFIDVSGLAVEKHRPLGIKTTKLLRGLAGADIEGHRIHLSYRREGRTFLADRFDAGLFGLPMEWANDQPAEFRAGDLIVFLDVTAGVEPNADDTIKCFPKQNVTYLGVEVEGLLREAPSAARSVGERLGALLLRERAAIVALDTSDKNCLRAGPSTPFSTYCQALGQAGLPVIAADLSRQQLERSDPLPQFYALISSFDDWTAAHDRTLPQDEASVDRFVVQGHMLGTYSLAIINRAVARALETAHPGKVRVQAIETNPVTDFTSLEATDRDLVERLAGRPKPFGYREATISQHYPILAQQGGDLNFSLLAWEETRLPKHIVDTLNDHFQGVIAPTRSVEKALADSGVRIPIGTLGQPTQASAFYNDAPFADRRSAKKPATFLHVSSCFPRKGVDVLLRAWQRAFRRTDSVRLVIKTFPNPHNQIEEDVATLQRADIGLAPIEIINRDVSEREMIALYGDADAVVLPSRGEGFNLPALEAMLAGVPLIVTAYGGHRDFCSPENARLLDYVFAPAESHVADSHSLWVDPSEDDLVEALRERVDPTMRAQVEQRRDAARATALEVVDHAAWVSRLEDWVDTVQNLSAPARHPRIAWISTWNVQCGIAQYTSFLLNAMSDESRFSTAILCDTRTESQKNSAVHPCWSVQQIGFKETVLNEIIASEAEVVVLQHQDGLISWRELAAFASDHRLRARTTVFVLHNPRGLLVPSAEERTEVVQALRHVDRLLVHSVADLNLLKEFGLVDNVTLFPHGASRAKVTPGKPGTITNASPVIGCHGFFLPHKGIEKLVTAVAQLRKEWAGIRLRLVNARFPDPVSDAAIQSCKTLVSRLGLDDCIEWDLEFLDVSDIQTKLAGCDLVVLPYDQSQDSASGAARIALSSYAPILATDVNIFNEFRNVVDMVPNNEPAVLVERINHLLHHPAERASIQERIFEWLSSHEWRPTAQRLEDLVHAQILRRKSAGWYDQL